MDVRPEEMSPEELALFVKHCATLRASAQTMKATLVKESVKHHGAKEKKTKKNNVDLAMDLLNQLAAKGKSAGHTFVEILCGIGILAIVLMFLFGLFNKAVPAPDVRLNPAEATAYWSKRQAEALEHQNELHEREIRLLELSAQKEVEK